MSDFANYFVELYQTVLEKEMNQFNVSNESIRKAIEVMKVAYLPDPSWKFKPISELIKTNYDEPAFRCAYLHKHSMCYTGMVCHLLQLAIDMSDKVFDNFNQMDGMSLCSLGGGPGTDIVGLLAALASRNLATIPWSATIIDLDKAWKTTFDLILSELKYGHNTPIQNIVSNMYSYPLYFKTNLLDGRDFDRHAKQTIKTSDIITMVKFISAAACNDYTEDMVEKIFNNMKPGAMLIFVDNAGGGFDKMIKEKTEECGLLSIYGPLLHYDYEEPKFSSSRFGYNSQSKSKVVFEVYQKPKSLDYTIQFETEETIPGEETDDYESEYNINSVIRPRQHRCKLVCSLFCLMFMLVLLLIIVLYLFAR